MTDQRSIFPVRTATEEERLYFNMVDSAFEVNQEKTISNGQPAHAVYLLYKLLTGARRRIVIYTGQLKRTLDGVLAYGDPALAKAAVRFLERPGTELSVAVAGELDVNCGFTNATDHPFVKTIVEAADRIKGTFNLYDASEAATFEYHFAVMDEKAFRVEVDTRNAQAYASFGDTKFAQTLARVFDYLREDSKQVVSIAA